jgi:hypothetical protein
MNKIPCKSCANYIQALRQQPDQTFRAVNHGICAAQSQFTESDAMPGIPAHAERVPDGTLPKKLTVWKTDTKVNCTRAIDTR